MSFLLFKLDDGEPSQSRIRLGQDLVRLGTILYFIYFGLYRV
jgi:hypothetical protein